MKRAGVMIRFVLGLMLLLSGCSQQAQPMGTAPREQKIPVVVSILPQKTFVEKIGGDRVHVSVMVPPGASPATYAPAPQQLKEITHAQLYVMVGSPLPFENTWMQKIMDVNPNMKVVNSAEGIKILGNDPHIWLSPSRVMGQVENIYEALVEADPDYQAVYQENKEHFITELEMVDQRITAEMAVVENKKFMIFHPSWGYFAADYGLEQIPIQYEGKEANPAALQQLIDKAKAEGITVIFVQKQLSIKSAQMISNAINGKVMIIDPLAPNYIENLKAVAKGFQQGMKDNE